VVGTGKQHPNTRSRLTSSALGVLGVLAVLLINVVLTQSSTAAPGPRSSDLGVSAGGPFMWQSDADLERELVAITAAGVSRLRIDVDWSGIESTRGQLDWANTDRIVAAAKRHSLSVLGIVTYSPRWAQVAGVPDGDTHGQPADPAQFAAFAAAAATRYLSTIDAWEVWNEPNLQSFWSPNPNPGAYASLLAATYRAVKAVAPATPVISGGLAPATNSGDGSSIAPETFVKAMYDAGGGRSLDAVAVHPYSYPALPSDSSTSAWNTFQRLTLIRDIMVANGDGPKQVWLTEFGAPTGNSRVSVSESAQAEMIRAGIQMARAQSWMGPLFVYNGRDTGTNAADPEQNFGLVRYDFTPKPAFAAVLAAAVPTPPPTNGINIGTALFLQR